MVIEEGPVPDQDTVTEEGTEDDEHAVREEGEHHAPVEDEDGTPVKPPPCHKPLKAHTKGGIGLAL